MNNSWLIFDPLFPSWVVGAIVLFFGFFAWRETRRKQKFLVARILALATMLVSILGLIARPFHTETQMLPARMLLTAGYNKLKADSLLKTNSSLEVVRTREAASFIQSKRILDDLQLIEEGSTFRFVLGQGLPAYILADIDTCRFDFFPAVPTAGFLEVALPARIQVDQKNILTGIFQANGKTTISILSPIGVEDSVRVGGQGPVQFSLAFTPKVEGKFLYSLIASQNGKTLYSEKVPIEVHGQANIQILFLQKFPTAETRYLKNYLIDEGHALAIRYQTSQTHFNYEFANRTPMRIDRLTPSLLESVDLVFIDSKVLNEISEAEKKSLEKSILNGMGMVCLFEELPGKGKPINRFLPMLARYSMYDTAQIQLASGMRTLSYLPLDVQPQPGIQPIITSRDKVLSGYRLSGAGKIGFQLLRETYRLQLEDKTNDYSAIWSPLIERMARSGHEMSKIKITTPFPYFTNEPVEVEVVSSDDQVSLLSDGNLLPLTEDVVIDDVWLGKTWAGTHGWHEFSIEKDSTGLSYYVSEKGDWEARRIANQVKATCLAATKNPVEFHRTIQEVKPIPKVWFYLMFLLAGGFLWLAPKI